MSLLSRIKKGQKVFGEFGDKFANLSDIDLIKAFQGGNEEALAEYANRHGEDMAFWNKYTGLRNDNQSRFSFRDDEGENLGEVWMNLRKWAQDYNPEVGTSPRNYFIRRNTWNTQDKIAEANANPLVPQSDIVNKIKTSGDGNMSEDELLEMVRDRTNDVGDEEQLYKGLLNDMRKSCTNEEDAEYLDFLYNFMKNDKRERTAVDAFPWNAVMKEYNIGSTRAKKKTTSLINNLPEGVRKRVQEALHTRNLQRHLNKDKQ